MRDSAVESIKNQAGGKKMKCPYCGNIDTRVYKRPVAAADIQATIDSIETAIFSREEKEIPSSQIGEIVMESLKKLDPVAYVRFASVYREFKDVNTFMDELKKILE